MLDLAVAYNRYRFLGDEFLTWLWFLIEKDQNAFRTIDSDCTGVEVGSRIVLENRKRKSLERISIMGDDAGLEEGRLALKKGALLTELSLIFKTGEYQWEFSLKGESLNLGNLKTPGPALPPNMEEMELFLLDKTERINKITNLVETAFKMFIRIRVTSKWSNKIVPNIKKWITSIEV
jgi:hypothetical protein